MITKQYVRSPQRGQPQWQRRHPMLVRLRRQWPFAIWALAAGAATWLYWSSEDAPGRGHVRGMVDGDPVNLAPVETARIQTLYVVEGQRVREGEPIVQMDTSIIDPGITADLIDTIRIETAFGDTHQDVIQAVSQRSDAIANLEGDAATARLEWARDAAELEGLRAEHQRRVDLLASRVIDSVAANELLPAIRGLEAAVFHHPKVVAALERQLEDARRYATAIQHWLGQSANEDVSDAIQRKLAERSVREMLESARFQSRAYRDSFTLRAPYDGAVSATYFRPGDVVSAGLPIVRLVQDSPQRVRAFIAEDLVANLRVGDSVRLRPEHRPGASAAGVVAQLTSEVHVRAAVLTPTGRAAPLRTRIATIAIDGPHPFLAGESVLVEFPPQPHQAWTWLVGWLKRARCPAA